MAINREQHQRFPQDLYCGVFDSCLAADWEGGDIHFQKNSGIQNTIGTDSKRTSNSYGWNLQSVRQTVDTSTSVQSKILEEFQFTFRNRSIKPSAGAKQTQTHTPLQFQTSSRRLKFNFKTGNLPQNRNITQNNGEGAKKAWEHSQKTDDKSSIARVIFKEIHRKEPPVVFIGSNLAIKFQHNRKKSLRLASPHLRVKDQNIPLQKFGDIRMQTSVSPSCRVLTSPMHFNSQGMVRFQNQAQPIINVCAPRNVRVATKATEGSFHIETDISRISAKSSKCVPYFTNCLSERSFNVEDEKQSNRLIELFNSNLIDSKMTFIEQLQLKHNQLEDIERSQFGRAQQKKNVHPNRKRVSNRCEEERHLRLSRFERSGSGFASRPISAKFTELRK